MFTLYTFLLCVSCVKFCSGSGLLFLYQPQDITNECAFSRHLRYDISYGMGMSDTITMILRTLYEIDYECQVEVVTTKNVYMLVVVRYPNAITSNCAVNRNAITILKRDHCIRLCDLLDREVYSPYFIFTVKDRLRFLFRSNSSISSNLNANFYQVTLTSARSAPKKGCYKRNETICTVEEKNYCFTTGVVCDGIKNCGVDDWMLILSVETFLCDYISIGLLYHFIVEAGHVFKFDERKSLCSLPIERLGFAPVIAVMAALLCFLLAGGHILLGCLPSHSKSFFIFNANEDNRFCIDPVLRPSGTPPEIEFPTKSSIIPVDSLSLELVYETNKNKEIAKPSEEIMAIQYQDIDSQSEVSSTSPQMNSDSQIRKSTITQKFQERIKTITNYALKGARKTNESTV